MVSRTARYKGGVLADLGHCWGKTGHSLFSSFNDAQATGDGTAFRLLRQRTVKRGVNQFADGSNVIGYAKLHRGCDAQAFVNAAQVVVRDIEGHRCAMVQVVLAERVGETRKAAL